MYSGLMNVCSCIPLISAFCPWRCLVVFEDHAKKGVIERIAKLVSDEDKEAADVERTAKTAICRRCCRAIALIVVVLSIVLIVLIAFYLQSCLSVILR